jgi:hypothetical protein
MRIVVERGVRRPKVSAETATAIDRLLVALVFDKRVGDGKNIEFGCKVLASLSLLQKVGDQAWKPTPLMRELFIESCARQFAKERKQHLG